LAFLVKQTEGRRVITNLWQSHLFGAGLLNRPGMACTQ